MTDAEQIWKSALEWYTNEAGGDIQKLIRLRAAKLVPDAVLTTDDEGLPQTFTSEYTDAYAEEIRRAYIRKVTDELIADGLVEVAEITESGERVLRQKESSDG